MTAESMDPVPNMLPEDHSILNEMLAIRLQQLEKENGGVEDFRKKIGVGRLTYYTMLRGTGNPTMKTIERIAANLGMTPFELLGFDVNDARRALKKSGVDYDELTAAISRTNKASQGLARQKLNRK